MIDAYYKLHPDKNKIRRGNKMARERMSILYDFSHRVKGLVIGTSNKSELLLGYGTIYGDVACAFNPIGNLYKTQVRLLAKELGVPQKILNKVPSADLWKGQSDEGELGLSYEAVDRFLYFLIDKKYSRRKLLKIGYKVSYIDKVTKLIQSNRFKRDLPVIAEILYNKIRK